ncbi:MAG: SDR family NAD(P)-dependent oxidoreductase [Bacteroidales bacterium]
MNTKDFFNGKVIVITGASSGIGRATALKLSQLGSKIALASRNEDKLNSLRDEIRSKGGEATVIKTDVSSLDDTQNVVKETVSKWGRVDILITCAGKYVQDYSGEIDLQAYQQSLALNFFGTLNAVKSILPEMKRQGRGHILIINSLDSRKGIIGDGPYVSAKSAMDGFGDVLRQEMKPFNINVTSVYPGRVDTPMIENIEVPRISAKIPPEKVVKAIIKGIKRNRATVTVPSSLSFIAILNDLMPRLADWLYKAFKLEGKVTGDR